MNPAGVRKKRQLPRSRSGCLECRQHHQKCDERRPVCSLCQRRGRNCQYGLRITWGGRPFRKSTFGQYISNAQNQPTSVVTVPSAQCDLNASSRASLPFVYGVKEPQEAAGATEAQTTALLTPRVLADDDIEMYLPAANFHPSPAGGVLSLNRAPSLLPELPPAYRSLLDYFMHAAASFCCDESVREQLFTTFLPMGFETSHVMASLLGLAAVHRINAGLDQDAKQLALLQVVAVEQLRPKLSGPPTEAVMATILMLCYAEIVAGQPKARSWRLHLEGAASLFSHDSSGWKIQAQDSTRAFIARCFVSLAALANLSGCPPTDSVSKQALRMVGKKQPTGYIDEFTAYSIDIVDILFEIGALVREQASPLGCTASQRFRYFEKRSLELVERLRTNMDIGYAKLANSKFEKLTSARKQQYLRTNEAYHQAAMLQIHQQLRGLPPSAEEIQSIVRRILVLLSEVDFDSGPCPGVVLLFPVFSAGCGAIHPADRQQVRDMLDAMTGKYRIANVEQGRGLLETLWSHRDEHGESEANNSWGEFIDKDTDIILY